MLLIWQTQIPRYILGILVISFLALWNFFNGNFHSEGCNQSMLFFNIHFYYWKSKLLTRGGLTSNPGHPPRHQPNHCARLVAKQSVKAITGNAFWHTLCPYWIWVTIYPQTLLRPMLLHTDTHPWWWSRHVGMLATTHFRLNYCEAWPLQYCLLQSCIVSYFWQGLSRVCTPRA